MFLALGGEALQLAGVDADHPIAYEGLLGRHLAEHRFRGREHRKFQFAVLASAAARGGITPDVLDEVIGWRTDDFWFYALGAAVAVIRACAERASESVSAFSERLAASH